MVAGAALRTSAKLSVLVIDDDPDILEYLPDFLGAEGFEVTTLADPSLAVERIRDEVFHLVVLDLMMPKISGLDLLAPIRAVDGKCSCVWGRSLLGGDKSEKAKQVHARSGAAPNRASAACAITEGER